jgi:hypothetical protein
LVVPYHTMTSITVTTLPQGVHEPDRAVRNFRNEKHQFPKKQARMAQ